MGLIQAAGAAIGGNLGDQYLDAFEAVDMGEGIVFTKGAKLRADDRRNTNRRGTDDVVTNGSVIHVYDNQAMILTDGGRISDFSAQPGVYSVNHAGLPTIFSGDLKGTLMDSWERFKFGGGTPQKQQIFYVNLQEIKGIKFGTPNALNYFDTFYNAELFLRCHGTFSIRIADPILFYQQAIPRDAIRVHIDDIKEQYMSEFLEALQTSINQMSVDGIRISQVASKMRELSKYMRDTLDDDWLLGRGMEIQSVGIASISYDDESRKLIDMRNQGAMLSDPSVREGYVQGAVARGMEAAGSNEAGAGIAFMGMGMGMQAGGGFMQAASQSNQQQMQQQQWQQQQQMPSQGQMPPQGWGQPQQMPPQGWGQAQPAWGQPQQMTAQGQMPPQGWGQAQQMPPQGWGQAQQQVPPQGWGQPQQMPAQGQMPSQGWGQAQPAWGQPQQQAPVQGQMPVDQSQLPGQAPQAGAPGQQMPQPGQQMPQPGGQESASEAQQVWGQAAPGAAQLPPENLPPVEGTSEERP